MSSLVSSLAQDMATMRAEFVALRERDIYMPDQEEEETDAVPPALRRQRMQQ